MQRDRTKSGTVTEEVAKDIGDFGPSRKHDFILSLIDSRNMHVPASLGPTFPKITLHALRAHLIAEILLKTKKTMMPLEQPLL